MFATDGIYHIQYPSYFPLRIAFVAFSSPQHLTLSNPLAIETLSGDIEGYCGNQITTQLYSAKDLNSIEQIVSYLCNLQPTLIGLSVQPGSLELVDKFITLMGQHATLCQALYLFGNQIPTYFPDEILKRYQINGAIVVRGEGEFSLRRIVKGLLSGELNLRNIPNLVYKDGENFVHTQLEQTDLSDLKYPPNSIELQRVAKECGIGLIEGSRGCSYGKCVYCTRASFRLGKGWEPLPLSRILDNFSNMAIAGVQCVEFVDDEFFGGRDTDHLDRTSQLAEGMLRIQKETPIRISFGIMTTPHMLFNPMDCEGNIRIEEIINRLRNAGLVKIYWGVETMSYSQLVRYGKKTWMKNQVDVKTQYQKVIELLNRVHVVSEIGLASLDPFISFEELQQNLELFDELGFFTHNMWPFRPLQVNEGSLLAKHLHKKGLLSEININFMRYEYEYQDPRVSLLMRSLHEIDERLPHLMPLVYRVRTISRKQFSGQLKTDEVKLAEKFLYRNSFAYIDHIKKGLKLFDRKDYLKWKDKNAKMLAAITNETVCCLSRMQEEINDAFASGLLTL